MTVPEPWTDDDEIIAEVAGMISDEIGERLRYEGAAEFCPLAVDSHPEQTRAVIDLEDGRHLVITVHLEGEGS